MAEQVIGMLCTQTTKGVYMAKLNIPSSPQADLNDFSVLVSNRAIGLKMGGFRNLGRIINAIAWTAA